jgi:hypothetical protein
VLQRLVGHNEAAESNLLRALAIAEKAFGPDHPLVANILMTYEPLLRKTGRKREARVIRKRVRALVERTSLGGTERHTVDIRDLAAFQRGR